MWLKAGRGWPAVLLFGKDNAYTVRSDQVLGDAAFDDEILQPVPVELQRLLMHAPIGLTPVRYYQRLNQLADTEAALAHNPVLVNRLCRVRTNRSRSQP